VPFIENVFLLIKSVRNKELSHNKWMIYGVFAQDFIRSRIADDHLLYGTALFV
jgi:hypothetical protein